uniref:Fibulin-1 n=1 Tax=Ciona savignyi TaxID=51511 RepID=H2ZHD3_CIOSA
QPCDKSNCPPVNNCINETTSEGACCPSCDRLGCRCQGYQYYDCLLNGFVGGLVPEGESYSVDDGSTMCSCPMGGGMILCRYSPHLPRPFCIQTFTRPADGCEECLAVGCVAEDGQKYQGGVNFDRPPCTVCYCPPEGGDILCATDHECQERTKQQLGDMEGGYDTRYLQSDWNKFDSSNPAYQPKGDDGNLGTQNSGSLAAPPLAGSSDASETVAAPGYPAFPYQYPSYDSGRSPNTNNLAVGSQEPNAGNVESANSQSSPHQAGNYPSDGGNFRQDSTDLSDQTGPNSIPDTSQNVEAGNPQYPGYPANQQYFGGLNYAGYNSQNTGVEAGDLGSKATTTSTIAAKTTTSTVRPAATTTVPTSTATTTESTTTVETPAQTSTLADTHHRHPGHRLHGVHLDSHNNSGSFENVLTACCYQGKQWALDHNSCTGIRVNVKTYSQICAVAQEKCCLEAEEQENCDRGIAAARSMAVCDAPTAIHGQCERDGFKSCCDCCALGLKAYGLSLSCDMEILGEPCNSAYSECCRKGRLTTSPGHSRNQEFPLFAVFYSLCSLFKTKQLAIQSGGRLIRISYSCDDQCKINMWGTDFRQRDLLPAAGKFRSTAFEVGFKRTDAPCLWKDYPDIPRSLLFSGSAISNSFSIINLTVVLRSCGPIPDPQHCYNSVDACDHICTDISSGIQCSCREGYSLEEDGFSCNDINECNLATHTCLVGQICFNTIGSFTCQRLISCGTGYELTDRNTCDDIDECQLNIHNCGGKLDCVNIRGSFRCVPKSCDAGYFTDAVGGCTDIDECRSIEYTCPAGTHCRNTVGSYECVCPVGFILNVEQQSCEDIDECALGFTPCLEEGATCVNTEGSFTCMNRPSLTCTAGYQLNLDGDGCIDVDECESNSHECSTGSTCINEDGSYRCQDPIFCRPGTRPSENQRSCIDLNFNLIFICNTIIDIDECEDPEVHQCGEGAQCVNVPGSFRCTCNRGYRRTLQNGRTHCEEINECALAAGERCTYRCENTPGSYTCVCPNGYNLVRFDGTCKDIDECASGSHNCSESETCFNTRGGFKCVEITCPEHYARLSNKKRCVRQSCKAARNKRECIRRPKQITYHNISLRNNAAPSTTVFRLSLGKGYPRDRYFFILSKGNKDKLFRLAKRRYKRRKTGIMYTTRRLTGPNDYVVDLTLKLYRKKKWTTFISRLYIFVSEFDF